MPAGSPKKIDSSPGSRAEHEKSAEQSTESFSCVSLINVARPPCRCTRGGPGSRTLVYGTACLVRWLNCVAPAGYPEACATSADVRGRPWWPRTSRRSSLPRSSECRILLVLGGFVVLRPRSVTWCALALPYAVTVWMARCFSCVTFGNECGSDRCLTLKDSWLRAEGYLVLPSKLSPWTNVTAQELADAAKKQRGSSAGLDGWTGSEVADIPLAVWDELAPFFSACERWGKVPDSWRRIRQVHIPKPHKANRPHDAATPAENMRPISVITTFWRVYTSARFEECVCH